MAERQSLELHVVSSNLTTVAKRIEKVSIHVLYEYSPFDFATVLPAMKSIDIILLILKK